MSNSAMRTISGSMPRGSDLNFADFVRSDLIPTISAIILGQVKMYKKCLRETAHGTMVQPLNRRSFLGTTTGLAGAITVGFHSGVSSLAANTSSLDKLNIAAIGTSNRAAADINGVASENIVALADIDENFLGQATEKYSAARPYRDWRVMLEAEADRIDAVVVGTPDHTHAPAAAMAMRMKKHVYCEKPLTHTVLEARTLAELAKENSLVTQMGTQIHALDNYRRVVELVQSGAIGEIRKVHVWTSSKYSGRHLVTGSPTPKHVDWDLWLGPVSARPYCESVGANDERSVVHPFNWRWFWDYGSGSLGDFGCHYMDLAHWALELKHPTHVTAKGPTPLLSSATAGLTVDYDYPARGDLPPVKLKWYDGGKRPVVLSELKDADGQSLDWESGQLFEGADGMLLSDYSHHLLLPTEKFADYRRPEPFIPPSLGHHAEWIHAIKTSGQTTCNFDYSGALTEAVLLGVASYRSGEDFEWDAAELRVTNSTHAQQFIHKEYRDGWSL